MNKDELKVIFDQQATHYDAQWLKMAPIYENMFFLLQSVFQGLASDARILCIGVGTGSELLHLAKKNPGWNFTAVEPSAAMLAICRERVDKEGISARVVFHEGYVDDLPVDAVYDGSTCFLVSHFILDPKARTAFFQDINRRLKPAGILATCDLATDVNSENYENLLGIWQHVMTPEDVSPEGLKRLKDAYAQIVAILPPNDVAAIIQAGGFQEPIEFFQATLIHAWFATKL